MSLSHSFHGPIGRRRDAGPAARRRRPSVRPTLEGLEDRLVLSHAMAPVARPHAVPAEVHTLAAPASMQVSLPIAVTGIAITNVVRDAATGALDFAGTLTGTILGKTFDTPLSGTITPARNARGLPILDLNLQPIHLSLLGLDVDTSAICLRVADRRGGPLGNLLGGVLNDILGSAAGGTGQSAMQLNGLLNNGQVLDALNRTLDRTKARLGSVTPAQGMNAPIVNLSLGPVRLNLLGLNVRLDNCANGPVNVRITAAPGGRIAWRPAGRDHGRQPAGRPPGGQRRPSADQRDAGPRADAGRPAGRADGLRAAGRCGGLVGPDHPEPDARPDRPEPARPGGEAVRAGRDQPGDGHSLGPVGQRPVARQPADRHRRPAQRAGGQQRARHGLEQRRHAGQ